MMKKLYVYLLAFGVFFTATSELVVSGILNVIAEELHISTALAGQLITAYSLAFAIGTPIIVSFTSRMERKQVLVGSLAVFILGCLVSFASAQYATLMVSRMILGASSGVYLVVALGSVAKLVPADKMGGAIGTVILGFSSAMVLGVPIGIAIAGWLGWQAIFLILGLFSLLVMVVIFRRFPKIEGDAPVSFKDQLKVLGNLVIVSGLFLTFFRESGNSVMFTYLTPFLQSILQMKLSTVGMLMLVFGIFGVIGSQLGGFVVDKWGVVRMILIGLAVHVVSLALLPLFSSLPAIGCLLIAVIVLAMFTTAPAIQTFFIQQAPQSANLVLSLQTSIIHLGLAAGAGAGGVMVNAASTVLYNPWLASLIVGLGLVAALACVSLSGRNDAKPAQN